MTRSERTYYLLFGGYSLAQFFIGPIYPLFLLSRGLDLFQINAVLATYLITAFLLDVPTGALADVFGRRRAFVLGCLVRMGAYALYVRAGSFRDCVVAEFIDAVGTVLVTGALEAWAVDGVRRDGDQGPIDRLFARGQVIARAVMIGGGIAAGHLGQINLAIPWLVAAATFAATALAGAVLMDEPARPATVDGVRPSLGRTTLDGIAAVGASRVLLLIGFLTLAGAFAGFPLFMMWQPRLEALTGEGPWLVGWVLAALNLAALAGSALVPRLLRRFSREVVLAAATCWRALLLLVAAAASTVAPMLAGLILQEIAMGLSDPIVAAWTNEHVPAEQRATVLSVRSTFFTLGGAAGLVTLGLLARSQGIPAAWATSAAIFALIAPGFLVLGRVAGRVVGLPAVEPRAALAAAENAEAMAAKEGIAAGLPRA